MTIECRRRLRRGGCVAAACALLLAGAGASHARAQQTTKTAGTVTAGDAAALPVKLTGSWHLNKDQSLDPTAGSNPDDTTGRPNGAPARGGSRGGGGGFGGLGSLLGGGRGGGRGGGAGREYSGTTEQQREVQALTTEVRDTPQQLVIAAAAGTVTITADDNDPRVFAIRNLKEKVDLTLAKVDVTSRWDVGSLVQDFDAGSPMKLEVTYTPSADGKQLTVMLVVTRPKNQGGAAAPVTRVYDRAR